MIADFLGIQLTPKPIGDSGLQPRTRWQLANENGSGSSGSANTQRRVSNFSVSGARGLANSPTS